jgi:hypothetical protein
MAERIWVPVDAAAKDVGVPVATVHDWYTAGVVDTEVHEHGRVVDLRQVREEAMGYVATLEPSGLSARLADPEAGREDDVAGLKENDPLITDLQELTRDRLDP